jgi:hypothetical protein
MLLTVYKNNLMCFVTQTALKPLVRIVDPRVHQPKLRSKSQLKLKELGLLMPKTVPRIHLKLLYREPVVLQKLQRLILASHAEIV